MSKGIGVDILEISRMQETLDKQKKKLLDRLFSEKEQTHCQKFKDATPHYAGRFAAKEAIVKALGTGFGEKIGWLDVEILPDEKGKPIVHFSEKAQKTFSSPKVEVSISHCKNYVAAVALWI